MSVPRPLHPTSMRDSNDPGGVTFSLTVGDGDHRHQGRLALQESARKLRAGNDPRIPSLKKQRA